MQTQKTLNSQNNLEKEEQSWRNQAPWLLSVPQRYSLVLLLLLLSRFSCVWLCATPEMEAHQAPPSLGFSRQEHWSGLPFPSPMHEVKSKREVAQSCPTPSDPIDCSLSGSYVHRIFQARVLEWGAIAFSNSLVQFISSTVWWSEVAQLCPTLCNLMDCIAYQAPPSMGFYRQEYWRGLPFLLQGIFLTQGSNLGLPHSRQML